jgi:hypothetical protein
MRYRQQTTDRDLVRPVGSYDRATAWGNDTTDFRNAIGSATGCMSEWLGHQNISDTLPDRPDPSARFDESASDTDGSQTPRRLTLLAEAFAGAAARGAFQIPSFCSSATCLRVTFSRYWAWVYGFRFRYRFLG